MKFSLQQSDKMLDNAKHCAYSFTKYIRMRKVVFVSIFPARGQQDRLVVFNAMKTNYDITKNHSHILHTTLRENENERERERDKKQKRN